MSTKTEFDVGPFRTRLVIQPHERRVYCERTQWNEQEILKHNAELRKLEQRKMEWGRQVAKIPQIAMPQLYREYPDLLSRDRKARDRALFKVLAAHPEWRVVPDSKIWARPSHAKQDTEAGPPDGGSSALPEVRQEGWSADQGSEGI